MKTVVTSQGTNLEYEVPSVPTTRFRIGTLLLGVFMVAISYGMPYLIPADDPSMQYKGAVQFMGGFAGFPLIAFPLFWQMEIFLLPSLRRKAERIAKENGWNVVEVRRDPPF